MKIFRCTAYTLVQRRVSDRGMVWVCAPYVTNPGLYSFQDGASAAKRGLRADSELVPSWEWRKTPIRWQKIDEMNAEPDHIIQYFL